MNNVFRTAVINAIRHESTAAATEIIRMIIAKAYAFISITRGNTLRLTSNEL